MELYKGKYPIPNHSEYVIDYVCDNVSGEYYYYYQLIRIKDDAILCSYKSVISVKLYCWDIGIQLQKVAFI